MSVEIVWCFPAVLDLYPIKPLDYLSHLLGHEGKSFTIIYRCQCNAFCTLRCTSLLVY